MCKLYVIQGELPSPELKADWLYFTDIVWFTVYDKQGSWLAYGGLQFNRKFPEVYLGPSFVRPLYRGQGLQRLLIQVRELYAKKNGFSVLTSCCYPDNIWSIRNLVACGYEIVINNEKETWVRKWLR